MKRLQEIFAKRETEDVFRIKQKRYGLLNRDKIIYYIENDNKNLGFFAMYRAWLEYLYFADVCGYVPVVYAGDNFIYKEDVLIHGTKNPFEYYFNQPASVSVHEVNLSSKVIHSDLIHKQMVELILTGKYNNYRTTRRYMQEMARIVRKYIKFNPITWKYVSEGIQQMGLGKEKVLGVHIRGTDFRANYDNHPVNLTEEDCFRVIDPILEKGLYNKLFIATDDKRILKNFIDRYGEILCFYGDVERGNKNQSVAFSKNNRKNHQYCLGLEVVRDMYSLSMCSGLVAGISQVAICAQIHKLARREQYLDVQIIDKGININGHRFRKRRSK